MNAYPMTRGVTRAMITQLDRVNDKPEALKQQILDLQNTVDTSLGIIEGLRMELRLANATIAERDAEIARLRKMNGLPDYLNKNGVELVTPREWCATHRGSITMLSRALNQKGGYRLNKPGQRQSNGRWLLPKEAEIIKPGKHKSPKSNQEMRKP